MILIVLLAAEINMEEIKLGKLAQQKGTSSHVKELARMMVTEHTQAMKNLVPLAKAKALRVYVEPLITKSKDDSTHSRRVVFSYLRDKSAVSSLFKDVAPKISDRPGGYTRIIKLAPRMGDNAEMCLIELVDFNETMLSGKLTAKDKAPKTRRSRKKAVKAESTEAEVEGAATTKPKVEKGKTKKDEEPKSE